MGVKRVNLDPLFQPQMRGKAFHNDDWLSGLPDDVLLVILSSIPLKEAIRTSVLSSRWTNLWRHLLCLNFDADDAFHEINALRNPERPKYIKWVNSVLQSHKAPTLDEFRICFDSCRSYSRIITKWLEFAFARRVQRLELSIQGYGYDLGAELLGRSTSLTPFDFTFLKALRLKGVDVSGEDVDFFLRNCLLLEQLIVQGSYKMVKLEVCGPSLALKHLEIFYLPHRPPVKISAPKLTSLKVDTLYGGLLLENVPMLVEFNLIDKQFGYHYNILVHVLHCCISQLEILTVNLSYLLSLESDELCKFPLMPKLKKWKAEVNRGHHESLMILTNVFQAVPHLQELEVTMSGGILWKDSRKAEDDIKHFPHQHLKVLKLSGCAGRKSEIEFMRNICVNCVALEKIIIITDPRSEQLRPYLLYTHEERNARNYVKQYLEPHVPKHIRLLIL